MLHKPPALKPGDQVGIVSLSQGTLGEDFAAHQRQLGVKRLEELGLNLYLCLMPKRDRLFSRPSGSKGSRFKNGFLESGN